MSAMFEVVTIAPYSMLGCRRITPKSIRKTRKHPVMVVVRRRLPGVFVVNINQCEYTVHEEDVQDIKEFKHGEYRSLK